MRLRLARKLTQNTPPWRRRGTTRQRVNKAMARWLRRWSRMAKREALDERQGA